MKTGPRSVSHGPGTLTRALLLFLVLLPSCGVSQEDQDRVDALSQRASHYLAAEDLDRAEQQARLGLAIAPGDPTLNLLLGRTLLQRRDVFSVRAAFEGADGKPGPLLLAYRHDRGILATALLGEAQMRYAEFLIARADRIAAAILGLPDEDPELPNMEQEEARIRLLAREHLEASVVYLDEAIEQNPDNLIVLNHRQIAFLHLNRIDDSLAAGSRCLEVLSASRDYLNRELAIRNLAPEMERQIRAQLRDDLQREVEVRGLMAALHRRELRWTEAEHQLTAILLTDPNRADDYFDRGECRFRMGRLTDAADDMRAFLRKTRLSFESPKVQRALDILASGERLRP